MRTAKMLIVEDESVVAMDIQRGLTTLGYPRPELAASGTEALEKASELRPDLVLMDIRLHGDLDGIDAAEQIRSNLGIPVVYLTAYADDKTVERATKTQPYGYILKPFRERELGTAIEVALYNHQMEKEFKQRIEREQDELKRRQTVLEETAKRRMAELEKVRGKRALVRELRRTHPDWPQKRIAMEAGVTRAAVGHSLKQDREERFPSSEFCGTDEAARLLGLSRKAVVSQARSGKLKAERFGPGGPWMFGRAYLQSVLEDHNELKTYPSLVNAQEAAALLGIRRRTLWQWARSGMIEAVKQSNSREWRFSIDEVNAVVQKRQKPKLP